MDNERVSRRLSAILAADIVGYSRLMAEDESATLNALNRHRREVFDPCVSRHNGRIVKLMGDGALVEFLSVSNAVQCATEIQRSMADMDDAGGISLRIGVNLGDVILQDDDIFGDGVNVASRLEQLAQPGGVCVSSVVQESVGGRLGITFQDGGQVSVKNIDRAWLASALGHLGEVEEARQVWQEMLEINPTFDIRTRLARLTLTDPAHERLILQGLEKAGLLADS
ncbi:adenylate/guanylate cyclase domain-containing protein [Ruegeria pomeroyi]|uniref:adenylate/guanylate cyclase domain-containing protein n=1 Tax=Ruegeria pomeroyi TaxID=89184 RepID=UPI001F3AA266|nr:adenylate/guanylate cyclase domain-containing protein [Ruegeria pomeroyi]MCE8510090.1 adenylate/guanylate cyclase domain-containing protein [Ruegeria pomeroyi]